MEGTFIIGNGVMACNCTPHSLLVRIGNENVLIPESGFTLRAEYRELSAGVSPDGVILARTIFVPTPEGIKELEELEAAGLFPIGSILSAQAWPGRVFAPIPVDGFERARPSERPYRSDKFTVF